MSTLRMELAAVLRWNRTASGPTVVSTKGTNPTRGSLSPTRTTRGLSTIKEEEDEWSFLCATRGFPTLLQLGLATLSIPSVPQYVTCPSSPCEPGQCVLRAHAEKRIVKIT